jgi:hypothetical protein
MLQRSNRETPVPSEGSALMRLPGFLDFLVDCHAI